MSVKVKCPHCKTIKTIDKTDKNIQVRCSKREGGCGERFYTENNVYLEPKIKTDKTRFKTNMTKKEVVNLDITKFNGSIESLIIAMNYAINTIKNKKSVVNKDVNSTWYQHYMSWTKWRKTFQMGLINR